MSARFSDLIRELSFPFTTITFPPFYLAHHSEIIYQPTIRNGWIKHFQNLQITKWIVDQMTMDHYACSLR